MDGMTRLLHSNYSWRRSIISLTEQPDRWLIASKGDRVRFNILDFSSSPQVSVGDCRKTRRQQPNLEPKWQQPAPEDGHRHKNCVNEPMNNALPLAKQELPSKNMRGEITLLKLGVSTKEVKRFVTKYVERVYHKWRRQNKNAEWVH